MPIITKPKQSDYPAIAELINDADQMFLSIHSVAAARRLEVGQETAANLVAGEKLRQYRVVKDGAAIVAFASFRLKNARTAWISLLYVKTSQQHQGYGALLIKRIEAWAKRSGAKIIALETDQKATWAVNFYLKQGYQLIKPADLARLPFAQIADKAPGRGRCLFGKEI